MCPYEACNLFNSFCEFALAFPQPFSTVVSTPQPFAALLVPSISSSQPFAEFHNFLTNLLSCSQLFSYLPTSTQVFSPFHLFSTSLEKKIRPLITQACANWHQKISTHFKRMCLEEQQDEENRGGGGGGKAPQSRMAIPIVTCAMVETWYRTDYSHHH